MTPEEATKAIEDAIKLYQEEPASRPVLRPQLLRLAKLWGLKPSVERGDHGYNGSGPFRPKRGQAAETALRYVYDWHKDCKNQDCTLCGVLACPLGEPLHFTDDGCPADCGT